MSTDITATLLYETRNSDSKRALLWSIGLPLLLVRQLLYVLTELVSVQRVIQKPGFLALCKNRVSLLPTEWLPESFERFKLVEAQVCNNKKPHHLSPGDMRRVGLSIGQGRTALCMMISIGHLNTYCSKSTKPILYQEYHNSLCCATGSVPNFR